MQPDRVVLERRPEGLAVVVAGALVQEAGGHVGEPRAIGRVEAGTAAEMGDERQHRQGGASSVGAQSPRGRDLLAWPALMPPPRPVGSAGSGHPRPPAGGR